ncbi:Xanthine dehydrogenase molybdenum-binding subunit [Salinivirga cyanobacteriivorans]|uniref:Xanthine dehydrogenase molybdenum-binding subunit n=1 Tax=Salinivirga cyanobacteriivorans TaxID=1307839 RepID=A0A0S2I2B6_9BACT|nr:molybdopterin cofactor-binding domain-containing protein [Salinivirga cyanobacteriivorans]ALO16341.1 Xanthine dehydrogenase molybdenum-binding subunit [Salinivirga cyanobacteriivorans]
MKNVDSINHVTGKSVYLDDIPVQKGTLHAVVFGSPVGHGKIKSVDYAEAKKLPGIAAIITHEDITGDNQIGGIIEDEPLFAEEELHFYGQPIALIVAKDAFTARKAKTLIKVDVEEYDVVTDPREAFKRGDLLFPSRSFQMGIVEEAWKTCEYIFEGRADIGGQEHLYIETQGSYAYPTDNGSIKIHSSTQGPTAVQKTAARVLGLPMHRIEVDVARLGGAFGGKEDQASGFATMVALAAYVMKKPVKITLDRPDDMQMTGKRHPYSADYKIGLSKDLKIVAYQTTLYQNGGAASDLSPAIMERTLFHSTNSYYVPNTFVTVHSCKTNLPPNTAFRGFGAPQGVFTIESAIAQAADELNIPAYKIQEINFIRDGQEFQYGQIAENVNNKATYDQAIKQYDFDQIQKETTDFNKKHVDKKRGVSIMPVCFGISFTKTPMNQARSLVHIYQDGSVGISTGAIEMGQGVNTKIIQVAAGILSISTDKIKVESTNTTRVANTSPTAASTGADLNGHATRLACEVLINRLRHSAVESLKCNDEEVEIKDEYVYLNGEKTKVHWNELVEAAFLKRVCLTENGHYATPKINFDKTKEKGHPFAYHVYGTAITQVIVDCVRGTYEFDKVQIVHDFGKSMNPTIDFGQVEGALVQGMGWMTMEELAFHPNGKLASESLSTYKVPDIYAVPKSVDIEALETEGAELAILKSKAVGEPPFLYGIGAFFAIRNAVKSFNSSHKPTFRAPYTHEKTLMDLYATSLAKGAVKKSKDGSVSEAEV